MSTSGRGPAIIAANLSFFDHVALVCPWVADCASSERSILDSWTFSPARDDPVDRDNPRRAVGALETAAGVLRDDEVASIQRHTLTGRSPARRSHRRRAPQPHHGGVSRADGIVGTNRIQPPEPLPRPFRRAVIRFGPDRSSAMGDPSRVPPADHQRRDAGHRRTHWPDLGVNVAAMRALIGTGPPMGDRIDQASPTVAGSSDHGSGGAEPRHERLRRQNMYVPSPRAMGST